MDKFKNLRRRDLTPTDEVDVEIGDPKVEKRKLQSPEISELLAELSMERSGGNMVEREPGKLRESDFEEKEYPESPSKHSFDNDRRIANEAKKGALRSMRARAKRR